MKCLTVVLSLAVMSCVACGQEVLREISWLELRNHGDLKSGQVIEADDVTPFTHLKIENSQVEPRTFAVLSISDPGITASSYALVGEVRYENVEGTGYLEMWNYFPDGKMYFSRTLGDSGPFQSLSGSCGWRSFTLPFYIGNTTKMRPNKLDFNVVLPSSGTVYLSPIKLVEYKEEQKPIPTTTTDQSVRPATTEAWWSNGAGGWIGGITGSIIGVIGALIGTLAGFRKARGLVLSLLTMLFVFGLACVVLGLVAVISSQPYAVYYPFLLIGILCTILPLTIRRDIRKRYEDKELRKMKAMDIS